MAILKPTGLSFRRAGLNERKTFLVLTNIQRRATLKGRTYRPYRKVRVSTCVHSKRAWLAHHQIHKSEGKCGESTLLKILSDSKVLMTNIKKKEGVTISLFQTPCKY